MKKMQLHSLALITILVFANLVNACTETPEIKSSDKIVADSEQPVTDSGSEPKGKKDLTDNAFIGLSKDEAEKLATSRKIKFRVINEDGVQAFVTKEYNPQRINATVINGKVTAVKRG